MIRKTLAYPLLEWDSPEKKSCGPAISRHDRRCTVYNSIYLYVPIPVIPTVYPKFIVPLSLSVIPVYDIKI